MDRNTIIGLVLIVLVFAGFSYLNQPSKEQIEAHRKYQDSIAVVQQQQQAEELANALNVERQAANRLEQLPDSVQQAQLQDLYGNFSAATQGTDSLVILENDWMEIGLTTHGGSIRSVRLKEYTNYAGEPLYLFQDADESNFEMTFITANNHILTTKDFYFEVVSGSDHQATLRLNAGENKSIDFVYTLHPDDYMVDFDIVVNNLQADFSPAMRTLDIQWMQKIRQQEKGRSFEDRYTRLTYKFLSDDVEQLREAKDDIRDISNKLKWIGYKDQFFSSVLIAGDNFETARLDSKHFTEGKYLKEYKASTSAPFHVTSNEPVKFNFYFGPNDYSLLKQYDKTKFTGQNLELEKLVPLGYWIIRPVNKYIIIPIFDWLVSWCGNLGLAIFLLTLIIKMGLFPLTYKSFMSSAKMRVLKPQVEAITAKYPGQDNALTRQQKTMEFYKQVGVSPMAGCIPMLLQFPFLVALFFLFPAAIELRQQGFLWASDLSTYDAVIRWNAQIPLVSQFLGNHISLFCVLMTVAYLLNTWYTMDQQNTGQAQMPGMKLMMYFMPVMMFFWFNSYAAGLNYYYLISTLITFVQSFAFRFFLNEDKLLAKLEANKSKAKPAKKKSGFMARLEEAQRQQQALLKERQKQQGKRK